MENKEQEIKASEFARRSIILLEECLSSLKADDKLREKINDAIDEVTTIVELLKVEDK